jgi:hypothetical protein
MNGEVGCGIIAQRVKIAFQPLLSSIRANWEFSSNCAILKGHFGCPKQKYPYVFLKLLQVRQSRAAVEPNIRLKSEL